MPGGVAGQQNAKQQSSNAKKSAVSTTDWVWPWQVPGWSWTTPFSYGDAGPGVDPAGSSAPAAATPDPTATPSAGDGSVTGGSMAPYATNGWDVNNQQIAADVKAHFNYYIWTGQEQPTYTRANTGGKGQGDRRTGSAPEMTYAGDYITQWRQNTNPAEVLSLQNRLHNAGLLAETGSGIWDNQTNDALMLAMEQATNPKDPTATVDNYIDRRAAWRAKNGLGGTQTVDSTTTQTTLTSPSAAKGLLYSALTQYLGHMPSDGEVAQFTASLNADEKSHPVVKHTTGTTDMQTVDPTTGGYKIKNKQETVTGGVDPSTEAVDYARAQPGSAEYQAATSYMDAFAAALKG